jgi:hypothetical protein
MVEDLRTLVRILDQLNKLRLHGREPHLFRELVLKALGSFQGLLQQTSEFRFFLAASRERRRGKHP